MNMKNTVILLIFLLSILGLILGVYYTEEVNIDDADSDIQDSVNEDTDSILTISPEEKENNDLSKYFT